MSDVLAVYIELSNRVDSLEKSKAKLEEEVFFRDLLYSTANLIAYA